MEIEPDAIIRLASHDTFGLSDRRHLSNETVLGFLRRGLMTQDALYARFTQDLHENLVDNTSNGPVAASCIKQAFSQLQESESGLIKDKFALALGERLSAGQNLSNSVGISALFDILTWHAAFPFPPTYTVSPGTIGEDGFFRAVCLLTRSPAPRYAPKLHSAAVHRLVSGTWGPHDGWLVEARGKDGRDFRRRLFRSLAVPAEHGAADDGTTPTTIPVPRFIMYQEDRPDQQVVIVAEENERSIDLQDVLSECPPERDPLTTNPLRESYTVIIDSLPRQEHDIKGLQIPAAKLVALFRLLVAVSPHDGEQAQGEDTKDVAAGLATLAARLEENQPSHVSWVAFDALLSSYTEQVANILSRLFSIFKAPLGRTST